MHSRKKKTDEQFKQEVYDLVGDEYVFVEDYINTGTKIRVLHRECGKFYEVSPNKFLNGRRCPHCKGKRLSKIFARTQEEFESEIEDIGNGEYTVLGEYVNAHTRIDIRHDVCGEVFEYRPYSILGGQKCMGCYSTNRKSHSYFLKEVFELVGDEYTVLTEYKNNKEKVTLRHEVCGHVYDVTPNSFTGGRRCPPCSQKEGARKITKTPEEFERDFYDRFDNKYFLVGNFASYNSPIKIRHNKCGYEWEVVMDHFYYFSGSFEDSCPNCRVSRGESRISRWLTENEIEYIAQHSIEECRDIRPLRFDFFLPDTCHGKQCVIEYDGEHHFMPIPYSSIPENNIKDFKDTVRRDEIKNAYCRDNDILLIRIPYWDFNIIEDILTRFLKCF